MVTRSSGSPRTQSVPTALSRSKRTAPGGTRPSRCSAPALDSMAPRCAPQATPIMYSSGPSATETTNSGGLGHRLPPREMEHLSGSTAPVAAPAINL